MKTSINSIYSSWAKILSAILVIMLVSLALPTQVFAGSAIDGDGAITVSPTNITYGSTSGSFTFTFTANNDFGAGSQVKISIPAGWSAPTTAAGAGHISWFSGLSCTLSGNPPIAIKSMDIFIDIASCTTGNSFYLTYSGVPTGAFTPYTFVVQTDIGPGGEGLIPTTASAPTVSVDPKPITVTGITTNPKVYDNTTSAVLNFSSAALVGVISPDVVTIVPSGYTANFDTQHFGTAKPVTISGLILGGTDGGNYLLTQPTSSGNITKKPITINAVTDSKTYDGTLTSSGTPVLSVSTPLASGDSEPIWTQTFTNKNFGTGNKELISAGLVTDGNSGNNYAYTYATVTNGTISKEALTVTAEPDTKNYDRTTSSAGVPLLISGTIAPGDTALTWTQTFDTAGVGTNKVLTPAGIVSDGNSGNNYAYTFLQDSTGIINPEPITVTADSKIKALGSVDPPLTYKVNPILFAGDSFTGSLARASGQTAGDYPITQDTLTAGDNYAITYTGANLTIGPSISGTTVLGGVKLSYIYGGPMTVTSASNGTYSLIVPTGWSGSVTPSLTGYVFAPVRIAYTNITTNQSNKNYNPSKERLKNGGFNTYIGVVKVPQYWTASGFKTTDGKDTLIKQEGTASVKIIGSVGTTKTLTQSFAFSGKAGDKFVFSFWVKGGAVPVAGLCRAQILIFNGVNLKNTTTSNCNPATYGFQKRILNITSASAYTLVMVRLTYSKSSGTIWFDGVSLMK